jgi:hypothetical protein
MTKRSARAKQVANERAKDSRHEVNPSFRARNTITQLNLIDAALLSHYNPHHVRHESSLSRARPECAGAEPSRECT